jgi:hypothetical protein
MNKTISAEQALSAAARGELKQLKCAHNSVTIDVSGKGDAVKFVPSWPKDSKALDAEGFRAKYHTFVFEPVPDTGKKGAE